jgi:hypothetical protein
MRRYGGVVEAPERGTYERGDGVCAMRWRAWVLAGGLVLGLGVRAWAQAQTPESTMSYKERESLRTTAASPADCVAAYAKILDDREATIDKLLAKPKRAGFAEEMHDVLDEFGEIADELNDTLDEYDAKNRDVRKALPTLVAAIERWTVAIRAAGETDEFRIARRIALNHLSVMHDLAAEMQETQETYFKQHPEALKAEQERTTGNPPQ